MPKITTKREFKLTLELTRDEANVLLAMMQNATEPTPTAVETEPPEISALRISLFNGIQASLDAN